MERTGKVSSATPMAVAGFLGLLPLVGLLAQAGNEAGAQQGDARASLYGEENNRIRRDKFDIVLPQVMRERDVDMWIHVVREAIPDSFAAGELGNDSGVFVFTDRGGDRIERAILGRRWGAEQRERVATEYTDPMEALDAYDIIGEGVFVREPISSPTTEYDYRFDGLREFVAERDPDRIAVNFQRELAPWPTYRGIEDGLSHTDYVLLAEELGEEYADRLVSSEWVMMDYIHRKVPSEIDLLKRMRVDEADRAERAFAAVEPGVTPTRGAGVTVFRRMSTGLSQRGRSAGWENSVVQGGDILAAPSVGMYAYVLHEGETEPPTEVQRLWAEYLKVDRIFADAVRSGLTGREIVERYKRGFAAEGIVVKEEQLHMAIPKNDFAAYSAGLDPQQTVISIDAHGHMKGARPRSVETYFGPRIGSYGPDWALEIPLQPNHHFVIEYFFYMPSPAGEGEDQYLLWWDHEEALATPSGIEYLTPPQEELILISSASPPANGLAQGSGDYNELVALFEDFRASQEAAYDNGVPDYTPAGVAEQYRSLQRFQERLAAIETTDWPVWQQVDYHLVRAEMNAVEFHHRVLTPWARDPGFYSIRGGDAGASMQAESLTSPLRSMRPPFSENEKTRYRVMLRAIPAIYEQARSNLNEAAADLADLAIRNSEREAEFYDRVAERLQEHHPDLVADALAAGQAVRDYAGWLQANKHLMTAPAGIGKDNYSWWMRNVQLSPWGWEESNDIIEREYDRIITFLKLEEQRNRDLPSLDVAMTERDYEASVFESLHAVVEFLRAEEIMTIDDWVKPADYTGFETLAELDDRIAREGGGEDERLLPENSSVDTKYRQREMLPGETHEFIGHMLDSQRQERLTFSPIRSAGRRYNMDSMRTEGWAVALEELLMQAGVLDDRPRKGREMEYLMNASHMSLAIPDMKMHANEITLAEARRLCAEIMPRGWSQEDEGMVWFEMQSNIRNPGGFHSNVVTGKAYFMKLFRERAQELGDDFVLRDFIDEFLSAGIIPMSLIRWEMTGDSDDITLVTEPLPGDAGLEAAASAALDRRSSDGPDRPVGQASTARPGMVAIPAGSFMMGDAGGQELEKPVHEVELDGFYMDTHEVTLEEFAAFVGATGYVTDAEMNGGSIIWNGEDYEKTEGVDWRFDAAGNRHPAEHNDQPVTHLSWNDANAYCQRSGKRLPTEAEWEYAARGGERGYKFAWGNEPLGHEIAANVSDDNFVEVVTTWPHFEGYDDGYTFAAPVGSFPPNSFGLYDMAGNAWEWCADYFDPEFYSRSPRNNPRNDDPNERRVMRGNSWDGRPGLMRASRRTSDVQSNSYADTGFRCAKDLELDGLPPDGGR